ncbi:MAG: hypothetical protein IKL65_02105, partial [Bacilli bacterium]|nr:hypothetical protein [Bacilli bacterium]
IEDAREESNERSVDMFGRSIQNAVARYQLNNNESISGRFHQTKEDKKELVQGTTKLTVEYDGEDVVCSTIEIHKDGTIFLDGCGIKEIGDLSYGTRKKICKPVEVATTGIVPSSREDYETVKYKAGDEYTCEVKDGIWYKFFILSTTEDKVNLLMANNITRSGEPITSETPVNVISTSNVKWLSEDDYEGEGTFSGDDCVSADEVTIFPVESGPITAIDYLNDATLTWDNIDNLNETYTDKNEMFRNFDLIGKARLPKYQELVDIGCDSKGGNCPLWSIDNGGDQSYYYEGTQTLIPGVGAYWVLDTREKMYECGVNSWWTLGNSAWEIQLAPAVLLDNYIASTLTGVRPVITVTKDQIENNE